MTTKPAHNRLHLVGLEALDDPPTGQLMPLVVTVIAGHEKAERGRVAVRM